MELEHDPASNRGIVLDIGGEIGALVVRAPRSLLAKEIEISRCGPSVPDAATGTVQASRIHAVVREQSAQSGPVAAAVFPNLAAGDYILWGESGSTQEVARVFVEGGGASEVRLPG